MEPEVQTYRVVYATGEGTREFLIEATDPAEAITEAERQVMGTPGAAADAGRAA